METFSPKLPPKLSPDHLLKINVKLNNFEVLKGKITKISGADFVIITYYLFWATRKEIWNSYDFLQQQHLIELIRQRNIEAALDYAQTHLAERGEENPDILTELERTLALLAFEEPEKSPFGELLHLSQRQKVSEFNLP